MPLYEYRCQDCGERFEELVKNGQQTTAYCPHCSSRNLRRLFSTFGLRAERGSEATGSSSCSLCTSKSCSTCRL